MSYEATNLVWKHSRHKGGALLVLLRIAYYINVEKGHIAWVSVARLARDVRQSVRQTQRHIRSLAKSGELIIIPNRGPRGTNHYKLGSLTDNCVGDDVHVAADITGSQKVTLPASNGVTGSTQSVNEPLLESTPIVPKGDEKEFWIKVCFMDCFGQAVPPARSYVIGQLESFLHLLERKNAPALIEFYRRKPLNCKDVPFNSRKHSPVRLLLHLPEQLALAAQTCPPPPKPEFTIEQIWEFLQKNHPGCVLPGSLREFHNSFWKSISRKVYAEMRVQKVPNAKDNFAKSGSGACNDRRKEEPPKWREFFRSKYGPDFILPGKFSMLSPNHKEQYAKEFQTFVHETNPGS